MTTAEQVRAIRQRTGLSQAAFAEKFEIPKRTIENWEAGTREPPIYILQMLDVLADHPELL